jgi:hypothetical protein
MTIAHSHQRLRLWKPPARMIRWPFSSFATVVMLVIPLFWPILGVMLLAEAFCLLLYVVEAVGVNLVIIVAWLVMLAVRR